MLHHCHPQPGNPKSEGNENNKSESNTIIKNTDLNGTVVNIKINADNNRALPEGPDMNAKKFKSQEISLSDVDIVDGMTAGDPMIIQENGVTKGGGNEDQRGGKDHEVQVQGTNNMDSDSDKEEQNVENKMYKKPKDRRLTKNVSRDSGVMNELWIEQMQEEMGDDDDDGVFKC